MKASQSKISGRLWEGIWCECYWRRCRDFMNPTPPNLAETTCFSNHPMARDHGDVPISLFPLPLRLPLLHPRLDAFFGVFDLHQLFQINLLRAGQAFIQMDGVPGIKGFLGDGQASGAELQ